jgi:hypothetical protein
MQIADELLFMAIWLTSTLIIIIVLSTPVSIVALVPLRKPRPHHGSMAAAHGWPVAAHR